MKKRSVKRIIKSVVGSHNIETIRVSVNRLGRDIFDAGSRRKNKVTNIVRYGEKGTQTFFGYYDKTPFSKDNTMILANVAHCGNSIPTPADNLLVGIFDVSRPNSFKIVGESSSWCWQQGCRLQWFPTNENEYIIYNKMVNNNYGAVIQSVKSQEVLEQHLTPIYDIDYKGELALTLNFSRLGRLRPGYGYNNLEDRTRSQLAPDDDGVWIYKFSSRERKLIISLKDLSSHEPQNSMNGAEHYVNHLCFSPNSKRFMFFHLWTQNGRRYSRLLTADTNGEDIHLLNNDGKVSHYTWRTADELLATIHYKDSGTKYYLFNDSTMEWNTIYEQYLNLDGHPSYSKKGELVTDTYPDKFSERHLMLIRGERERLETLGAFYSPLDYKGQLRCDLHPRWDREGEKIMFDSAHSGERKVYILSL